MFPRLTQHLQNSKKAIKFPEAIAKSHLEYDPETGVKIVHFVSHTSAQGRTVEVPIKLPKNELDAIRELHEKSSVPLPDLRNFTETNAMHELIAPLAGQNKIHTKIRRLAGKNFEVTHFYFERNPKIDDTISIDATMDHIDDSTIDGPDASNESSIENILGHHETYEGGQQTMHSYTKFMRAKGTLLNALNAHALHQRIKENKARLASLGIPIKRAN